MSAREVVTLLPRRVRLWAGRDGLHYKAPKGAMTPNLRGTIERHKLVLLRFLGRAEVVHGMSLTQFENSGCCLEVQVQGLDDTLWFVPGLDEVESLQNEGVDRGRIWTAAELRDLITAPVMVHEDAVAIARVKIAFGAEVDDVCPSESIRPDDSPEPEQARLDLGSQEREFD